ncbi:hypothetical protein [Paraferrimonas haliotis]|uniref:Uncharacterized protein n=1 Tax=Paraferrimonas haliotis TaxID=2013866 RepID=A0AA37WVZ4_9GAMM|nr:hypothetical protein [Paraferrimonas haliotis]GLS82983.1 hypothetical protein GCM10007894_09600 [Paraferrimonas haliotis]
MSSWENRREFLTKLARRSIVGEREFILRRNHLMKVCQLSRGSIYNQFPNEADLQLSLAADDYQYRLSTAKQQFEAIDNPLHAYAIHHFSYLRGLQLDNLHPLARLNASDSTLAGASEAYRNLYLEAEAQYNAWNAQMIAQIAPPQGYNREMIVSHFITGTKINWANDNHPLQEQQFDHFCYALYQLLGVKNCSKPLWSDYLKLESKEERLVA